MQQSPHTCPSLFAALDWFRQPTLIRTNAETIALLAAHYLPTVIYRLEADLPSGAVALVCEGLSCQEPARSLEQLQAQLQARLTSLTSN
jgi:uncharacterized protein YyaL (SSP411 family)